MTLVRNVMTRTVVAATTGADFKELVRLMHEHRIGSLPILGPDDAIVGVVSEADLLMKRDPDLFEWHLLEGPSRREARRKAFARVAGDLMSAPAVTIGPEATTAEAAHLMREKRLKHLPVVNEHGHVLGMVSRVDLLAAFLRSDDAIADQVTAFFTGTLEEPERVRVEVHDGVATLAGLVEYRSIARRIADRVRLLEGVVAVEADHLDWEVDDLMAPASPVPWAGF